MGKIPRVDIGDTVFHAWNRGNAGGELFTTDKDYQAFEYILTEAKMLTNMRILGYCIMPNHWHLVLYPRENGDLARFFQWLTLTHTQRWHAVRNSAGQGHIYQGHYKSNVCESDEHFLRLVRYVERNALRAKLVNQAEDWRWSSGWVRIHGTEQQKKLLSEWPVPEPSNYVDILNEPESEEVLVAIRTALRRGSPLGSNEWTSAMIDTHHLESTIRPRGRPTK
jgi:putative transposase